MKKKWIMAVSALFLIETLTTFSRAADVPRMTNEELKAMLGNPDFIVIDVRTQKDWEKSDLKIAGAVREDPEAVESWAKKYPKGKTLVFYCA